MLAQKIYSQASNLPQKKRETSLIPKLPGNNFLHQSTMHSLNFTNKGPGPTDHCDLSNKKSRSNPRQQLFTPNTIESLNFINKAQPF